MRQKILEFHYDKWGDFVKALIKMKWFLLCFFAIFLLESCASTKVDMESLAYVMLIQHGQNAASAGRYGKARQFYDAAIAKYGENPECFVETQYEIAHMLRRQGKYKASFDAYMEVLNVYDSLSAQNLPMAYKKLTLIGLDKIPEKYKN